MSESTYPTTAEQVERSNESGSTPVVFVHGLWLLPSSWDRWATLFEEAGYAALTPGWPDDPATVEEANAKPEVFANKTVGQVADHFDTKNPNRGPLLIISGEKDHTVPRAIANASYKKQKGNEGVTEFAEIANRGHSLTIDSGWLEVADKALAFVQRFADAKQPQPVGIDLAAAREA